MPTITDLRCEYLHDPLGLDAAAPRLSWRMTCPRRGARQVAYRIRAAYRREALHDDAACCWDSGTVASDASRHVRYGGPPAAPQQRIWWCVSVTDEAGTTHDSDAAFWEAGLPSREYWRAAWIGGDVPGGPQTCAPAPLLRRRFVIAAPVVAARLYVTALGVYRCSLNGRLVSDARFTPGWTDYRIRVQYQAYDVTALLHPGANMLGAILGDGWYAGSVDWRGRQRYGRDPLLLAHLWLRTADGAEQVIGSDAAWQLRYGPILQSDMQHGEHYDARLALPGWDRPDAADDGWRPARLADDPAIAIDDTRAPLVRPTAELAPVGPPRLVRGSWIVDLGQNMVGWVRLRTSGAAGTTVRLRFAEVLNPDGTIYTANLRTARQTDYVTLAGDASEVFEPQFTFHGFRYVELTGLTTPPDLHTVTGVVVHSDLTPSGEFGCSDPLINQLQHNIVWGQRGNFVDVPTDCPQRDERLGWTGDAQVFIRTAAFNMDVAAFFTRWLRDLADAQSPEGAYPPVVPHTGIVTDDGGPAWADAGTICPWTLYDVYGDRDILAAQYDSMCRYVAFLERTSRDGIRCYDGYQGWMGFGDWLSINADTPHDLIGTAFFAHSARLLARSAAVLGHDDDAARYHRLADAVRDAFQRRFVTPDGLVLGATQTGAILALHFDLLPTALRPATARALVADIRRRGNRLSAGFVGSPYIAAVLSDNGYLDVAYDLLHQTRWPSWLYSVTHGATTIWERWDGWTEEHGFQDPGMNSFNHYAYGAIGAWLYTTVAGIDSHPAHPGHQRLRLAPRPGGRLSAAWGRYDAGFGTIVSDWRLRDGTFEWLVTVPANCQATAVIPWGDVTLTEGGVAIERADGVLGVMRYADRVELALLAGTYHITAQRTT